MGYKLFKHNMRSDSPVLFGSYNRIFVWNLSKQNKFAVVRKFLLLQYIIFRGEQQRNSVPPVAHDELFPLFFTWWLHFQHNDHSISMKFSKYIAVIERNNLSVFNVAAFLCLVSSMWTYGNNLKISNIYALTSGAFRRKVIVPQH